MLRALVVVASCASALWVARPAVSRAAVFTAARLRVAIFDVEDSAPTGAALLGHEAPVMHESMDAPPAVPLQLSASFETSRCEPRRLDIAENQADHKQL